MKNRVLLGAALAAGALLAGQDSRPTTQPEPEAPTVRVLAGCSAELKAPKPQSQKPASPAPIVRKVTLGDPAPFMREMLPLFRELPQRRRVKYGRNRWIVLG